MRTFFIIIFGLFSLGCATHPFCQPFTDWTEKDTHWQGVYTTAHCADWAQTRRIAGKDAFFETNPILGANPSRKDVDIYMGITLLLQTFIPAILTPEYRSEYQKIWTQLEVGTVAHNFQLGITF